MGRGHMLSSNVAHVDGPDWPPLPGPDVDEGCSWEVRVAKGAFPSDQHQNVSTQILPQSSGFSCSRPSTEDAITSFQTVLITPPPIPDGLQESSRIPTGFLLDFNKFSERHFDIFFISLPTGLPLDSNWTPTELIQSECNGFLTTLCNLITFYQYFNKSDLMPLENSIQKSHLSIDIALIAIYTIKYKKYFTHSKW